MHNFHFWSDNKTEVLLLDMNDDAYREYLALCNEVAAIYSNLTIPSYTIPNPYFLHLSNFISIWKSLLRSIRKLNAFFELNGIHINTELDSTNTLPISKTSENTKIIKYKVDRKPAGNTKRFEISK